MHQNQTVHKRGLLHKIIKIRYLTANLQIKKITLSMLWKRKTVTFRCRAFFFPRVPYFSKSARYAPRRDRHCPLRVLYRTRIAFRCKKILMSNMSVWNRQNCSGINCLPSFSNCKSVRRLRELSVGKESFWRDLENVIRRSQFYFWTFIYDWLYRILKQLCSLMLYQSVIFLSFNLMKVFLVSFCDDIQ